MQTLTKHLVPLFELIIQNDGEFRGSHFLSKEIMKRFEMINFPKETKTTIFSKEEHKFIDKILSCSNEELYLDLSLDEKFQSCYKKLTGKEVEIMAPVFGE